MTKMHDTMIMCMCILDCRKQSLVSCADRGR